VQCADLMTMTSPKPDAIKALRRGERPHQDLAELGVGLDECQHLIAMKSPLHLLRAPECDKRATPGNCCLRPKLPRPERHDRRFIVAPGRGRKLAAQNRKDASVLAPVQQHFPAVRRRPGRRSV
jgi:hypothetical protein